VFQHNGAGTVVIRRFQVSRFGRLYRSCGNCSRQHRRDVVVEDLTALAPGKALVGINANHGDTARLTRITIVGDPDRQISPCDRHRGVARGEPEKVGSGPDGAHCRFTPSDITYR
jgi:pectate lyase